MGTLHWKKWTFYLVRNSEGLCYVDVEKPYFSVIHHPNALRSEIKAFYAYLKGESKAINVQLSIEKGTPFQRNVWNALLSIPYGETSCYSDIANMIGNPKAVRAVGGAIGKNPILIAIPCHRVLSKDKRLTGFSSGLDLKQELLKIENIYYRE